jgi:sterol desaturase/sphingolipid hydroxylase (fatty acid hydroxylase superfamily)
MAHIDRAGECDAARLSPQSGGAGEAWRRLAIGLRAHWAAVTLVAGLLLAIAASAHLPPITYGGDDAVLADGFAWLTQLQAFFADLYAGLAFQLLIAMLAIGLVIERIIPARRDGAANGALNIPYAFVLVFFVASIAPLQVFVADTIADWLGWRDVFDLRFDPKRSILLSIAAMLVAALVTDFFFYWFHRLQHANRLLWPAHLLHHSDMALGVTTTHRTHFLEHVFVPFFMASPMTVLFVLPAPDLVMIGILPAVWSNVVHMNVRIGFGRLWWLLASPQYHRIHHSIEPAHCDKNFAVWFPIWDVIFGTAYAPRRGEFPATGVDGVQVSTLSGAVALPFVRWYRMASGRAGKFR